MKTVNKYCKTFKDTAIITLPVALKEEHILLSSLLIPGVGWGGYHVSKVTWQYCGCYMQSGVIFIIPNGVQPEISWGLAGRHGCVSEWGWV